MNGFIVLTLMLFAGLCSRQSHSSLDAFDETPECYTCNSHSHKFPACLYNTKHRCHPGQTCRIQYHINSQTGDTYAIGCDSSCNHPNAVTSTACPYGGDRSPTGSCTACCKDTDCTDRIVHDLTTELMMSSDLFCPHRCSYDDIKKCLSSGVMCPSGQYCEVAIKRGGDDNDDDDDNGGTAIISGHCRDMKSYDKCMHDHTFNPCGVAGHSSCEWDCCKTNQCLKQHFHHLKFPTPTTTSTTRTPTPTTTATTTTTTTSVPTTATTTTIPAPTTTTNTERTTTPAPTTTIVAPTTTLSYLEKYKTDCADQLEAGACDMLKTTRNVCHDKVAIELCPQTCGICQIVQENTCHDTVLNDGCKNLVITQNICAQHTAKYACPDTCGICDAGVNAAVTDIIDGKVTPAPPTTTSAPTTSKASSTTPTVATTTTTMTVSDSFTCTDLVDLPCDTVRQQCHAVPILKTECKRECLTCELD